MVEGHHAPPVHVEPLAVLAGDLEIVADEAHGGDAAQADDDLGRYQLQLALQPDGAGLLLDVQRVAVARRAALDHIADVDARAVQIDELQHVVQELPGAADEGRALQVLLFAGALADEHHLGVVRPGAEHHVVPRLAQPAAAALHALRAQLLKRSRHISPSPLR